eukprot:gene2773-3447_t
MVFPIDELKEYQDVDSTVNKEEPFIMGIDEAGRGPVLGPLVYGICYAPLSQYNNIRKMGFNDSKQLSENKRDELFGKICKSTDKMGYICDVIQPFTLSEKMLQRVPISLNVLSHDSAIGLINQVLEKGINVQELYIDTVGPPIKYQDKLKKLFPQIQTIIVSKQADSKYPIVSAASICAKVTRDTILHNFKFNEIGFNPDNDNDDDDGNNKDNIPNREFGSGYPGDPTTKRWIVDNRDKVFGFPNVIRFSWKTTTAAMQGTCYGVEWISNQPNSSQYFSSSDDNSKKRKRFAFFEDNNLKNIIDNEF